MPVLVEVPKSADDGPEVAPDSPPQLCDGEGSEQSCGNSRDHNRGNSRSQESDRESSSSREKKRSLDEDEDSEELEIIDDLQSPSVSCGDVLQAKKFKRIDQVNTQDINEFAEEYGQEPVKNRVKVGSQKVLLRIKITFIQFVEKIKQLRRRIQNLNGKDKQKMIEDKNQIYQEDFGWQDLLDKLDVLEDSPSLIPSQQDWSNLAEVASCSQGQASLSQEEETISNLRVKLEYAESKIEALAEELEVSQTRNSELGKRATAYIHIR